MERESSGGQATHRVRRRLGAGIGTSYPERVWLEKGTLLRCVDLRQYDQLGAGSELYACSVGRYEIRTGEHAGLVVTLTHATVLAESPRGTFRTDPGPVVEEHADLERLPRR